MENQDNIDMLIAFDYYWDTISGEIACGDDKLVIGNKFGWVVSRLTGEDSEMAHLTTSNLIIQGPWDFTERQNQGTELKNSLKRFWDIESVGITETSSKVNEDENFLRFIKFIRDEGTYETDLPRREQTSQQSNNLDLCVTILNCLTGVKKEEKLLQEYDSIFRTQLDAGIYTELVPKDEEDFEGDHFLPHHGVWEMRGRPRSCVLYSMAVSGHRIQGKFCYVKRKN